MAHRRTALCRTLRPEQGGRWGELSEGETSELGLGDIEQPQQLMPECPNWHLCAEHRSCTAPSNTGTPSTVSSKGTRNLVSNPHPSTGQLCDLE